MLAQDALYDHIATVRKAFTGPNGGDGTTEQVLGNLNVSCVMTSESILLLVAHGRTWDGELLVRSVLEGSYRFAALCVSDERERERRVTEYWDLLPDAARLRQRARTQLLLDAVGGSDVGKESPDLWRPLRDLLLSPTELQTLRDRFPAKARSQLEQRWSFTELAASLSKSDLPGAPHFAVMLHGYTMSSALIHKSGEGVAIVVERAGRPSNRPIAIELAHGARLISDVLALAALRAIALYRLRDLPVDEVLAARSRHAALSSELAEEVATWHGIEYEGSGDPRGTPAGEQG
jgi:hypothetical protein